MFDFADLTPHGFCLAWDPGLIWLQAASDLLIAVAYYSIPFALLRLTRLRQDLAFPWMFRLFAAFILACGTTHVFGVLTLWVPAYWSDAWLKAVTALLSVTTAAILWPLLPRVLEIPTQKALRDLNEQLVVEVGERRLAEKRLQSSEARLKSIYARSPAPLCAADGDGRLVEVSDQWVDLLGYQRSEVTGLPLSAFHAPETSEAARLNWEELLRDGALGEVEQTLLHRDGSRRLVLTSARLEQGGEDGSALAISAMTDITARREMETALLASEAHLRQAHRMEAVGQLTGGIAHDFNNMLTSITMLMELLHRRLGEEDASRRLVSRVLDVSARGARLTGQLLAFSRRQRLVAEPLDPLEVVENIRLLLMQPLGGQVVLDIMQAGADHWRCMADRSQLEAALLNLVLNAGAAITGPGRITIEVAPLVNMTADDLDFGPQDDVLRQRDYVAITVSDSGCGMPEEIRRRAFEPFFTTKEVGEGSGMGLSQTYGFARQSGGTVRLESTPGAGTRVTIVLPRAIEVAAAAAEPAQASDLGRGQRVLLVEDEEALRNIVAAALRAHGYQVTTAQTGEEAIRTLDDGEAVDLLFTDVTLPGAMTGVDLASAIRKRIPGLPVLFATDYSDRDILNRWPGNLLMLPKPYATGAVCLAIQSALAGQRRPAEHALADQSAASAT